MNLFGRNIFSKELTWEQKTRNILSASQSQIEANNAFRYKPYPSVTETWDGEKNYGELGYPVRYIADFRSLSLRSWQSFYESDITQIIIKQYLLWVVGRGLTLNSEPVEKFILKFDGSFNRDNFTDEVEDLWQIYSNSKKCSYSEMQDLHQVAFEALLNSIVGGDVLVVMRYDGALPSIQLIDGLSIYTPTSGDWGAKAKSAGNKIKHGVEVDSKGKHVAYYVAKEEGGFDRISAFHSKTGRPLAWMIYGFKYRLGDTRGMPLFAVVLEDLKKLGRYKEATVASAEENAKVAYTIEHDKAGTGDNPFTNSLRQAVQGGQGTVPETGTGDDILATRIAMTTNKQAFNLPPGSKLQSHKNEGVIDFKDFFTTNFDVVCATLGIAPEVAMNKYNSNYSASRMASKMSEFKFKVDRSDFSKSFYKPIYNFWLDTRILLGQINTTGYTTAILKNDYLLLEAFRNCEFMGPNLPHVDPVKEANAERIKLGDMDVPLTTFEKSARNLGEGDWWHNIENNKQERDKVKELGLDIEPANSNSDGN